VVASGPLRASHVAVGVRSQSPSLRGSGRFVGGFVAPEASRGSSQSPSLRGSGRFSRRRMAAEKGGTIVSIPFIAGQWSLPGRRVRVPSGGGAGLNPLHCGAVVASQTLSARYADGVASQSPSLRGSGRFLEALARNRAQEAKVSIPFIAGQWSLPSAPPT